MSAFVNNVSSQLHSESIPSEQILKLHGVEAAQFLVIAIEPVIASKVTSGSMAAFVKVPI